jgi:hypothetical protein
LSVNLFAASAFLNKSETSTIYQMEANYEGNQHPSVRRGNAATWKYGRSRRDQRSLKVRSRPSDALLRTGEIRLRAGTTPSPRCDPKLHAGLQNEAPVYAHSLAALFLGRGISDEKALNHPSLCHEFTYASANFCADASRVEAFCC